MTYPTPPGENVPLYEGLDPSWNDFVSVIPEEKRADFASKVQGIHKEYEPLKQWEDFTKSGITPEHAQTALGIYSMVENQPQKIYEELGKFLNITPQQAQQVAEQMEEQQGEYDEDPRIATMQQQIETLMQIKLAEHNQMQQRQQQEEAEAAIDKELSALRKQHGEFDEEQVVMRMLHKGMSATDAFKEYSNWLSEVRRGRPTPMVMGGGGAVPSPSINVKNLDSAQTKNLVAQMLEASKNA